MIEVLGGVLIWLLIGLVTQLGIRVVQREKIFAGGEYYFWSAVAGPFCLIMAVLWPFIDWYNRPSHRPQSPPEIDERLLGILQKAVSGNRVLLMFTSYSYMKDIEWQLLELFSVPKLDISDQFVFDKRNGVMRYKHSNGEINFASGDERFFSEWLRGHRFDVVIKFRDDSGKLFLEDRDIKAITKAKRVEWYE